MRENIVLTGFMASGKTTVAAELARKSGMEIIDTDALIEQREGRNISQIFECDGEEYFRDVESKVCAEAAERSGCVISTGGGVVLRPENIEKLRSNGVIFLLDVPFDIIASRLEKVRASRPLAAHDSMENIRRRYNDRKPFYDVCDCRIRVTDALTPEETAGIIFDIYKDMK